MLGCLWVRSAGEGGTWTCMMLKRLSTNADAANVDTHEPRSASTVFTMARSCADWSTAGSAAAV